MGFARQLGPHHLELQVEMTEWVAISDRARLTEGKKKQHFIGRWIIPATDKLAGISLFRIHDLLASTARAFPLSWLIVVFPDASVVVAKKLTVW